MEGYRELFDLSIGVDESERGVCVSGAVVALLQRPVGGVEQAAVLGRRECGDARSTERPYLQLPTFANVQNEKQCTPTCPSAFVSFFMNL